MLTDKSIRYIIRQLENSRGIRVVAKKDESVTAAYPAAVGRVSQDRDGSRLGQSGTAQGF